MHRVVVALIFSHLLPVAQMTAACRATPRCFTAAMTAMTAGETIGFAHRCGVDSDRTLAAVAAASRFYQSGLEAEDARLVRGYVDDGWAMGMRNDPPGGVSCQQIRWALVGLEAEIGAK